MRAAIEPAPASGDSSRRNSSITRVMIVDDSLVVRSALRRAIEEEPDLEILTTASTGEQALDQLRRVAVDVILLDLEMPGMGGLEALPLILDAAAGAQVLVVSSLTSIGAEATLAALSMGAADTLLKPQTGGFTPEYRRELVTRIRALGAARHDPLPTP
ncbi:MAG: response regulator, partial [Sphingomonadales bacterium]|nr:response regulator [Sphingomonadales bacterium]